MDNASELQITVPQSSPSYFSLFRNLIQITSSKIHEAALNGCDCFGKWITSYASDIPPAYFAKSFGEINYAHDALFWQGCFYEGIEELQKTHSPNQQEFEQLVRMQDIVFSGFLSPFIYEKEIKDLENTWRFLSKNSHSSSVNEILDKFRKVLLKNDGLMINSFKKDLLDFFESIQCDDDELFEVLFTDENDDFLEASFSNDELFKDFKEILAYYKGVMNDYDYAEILASLYVGMDEKKESLSLSETQYKGFQESLVSSLRGINKKKYLEIREERLLRRLFPSEGCEQKDEKKSTILAPLEQGTLASFLTHSSFVGQEVSSFIKQGISFALKNPMQFIAMGLAVQTAAVAATSSFNLQECTGGFLLEKSTKIMRILTLDGGGVRGIVSATLLDSIQERLQNNLGKETHLTQCFDLMCGSSTSGIIVTGLNAGMSTKQLVNFYVNDSATIFSSWRKEHLFPHFIDNLINIALPKYSAHPLEGLLKEYFKDKWLNESYSPVLIPADNLGTQSSYLFDSCKAKELESENFKMRDVIRSAFAIPTYFPAAEIENAKGQEMVFLDGTVWANDPTSEAIRFAEQKCPECDLYVLSLGTWHEPKISKAKDLINSGTWGWGKQSLNQMLTRIQTLQERKFKTTHGCSQTSHGRKLKYNRFQVSIPSIDLDDAHSVPDLREAALYFLNGNREDHERLEQVVNELSELQKANAYYRDGCKNEKVKSTGVVRNRKDQSLEIEIQGCQGAQEKKLEQETAEAQRAEEANQERIQKQEIEKKEQQEPTDSGNGQATFPIREKGIEICINLYSLMDTESLTYGQLREVLGDIISIYEEMKREEMESKQSSQVLVSKYTSIITLAQQNRKAANDAMYQLQGYGKRHLGRLDIVEGQGQGTQKLRNLIKADVDNKMRLYKALNGVNHPLWHEFLNM